MESYLFRPTFWERKKYNGNGSFANSSIYISCVVPLQNEVNTITMEGIFKVKVYKRSNVSQDWTITETADQVYTSAWLTNAKNVDRKPNIHLGDGVSIDVTQYPDVVKMIFEVNFINTTMFNLHPPDWTPPDDATGEFYALSDELPTFRYEAFVWYMGTNGFPTNENIRDEAEYTEPIPLSQWTIKERYNNGFPFNGLLRDIPYSKGAFEDAASLASVRVPISVKTIGPTAFAGTALKRVKIAADCTYEETSFPEGCVIERYPDDRYGQLYDSAGKAVLDYDARRVYVLKEDISNG